MSTTYAVKMRRSQFLDQAYQQGWELRLDTSSGRDGGIFYRLYLHDGSEAGYAWDIEEERAQNGEWWTLFTRYAGADVSRLVAQFGAMDEHHPDWWDVFCDGEQQALREVREGAAAYFDYWLDLGDPALADDLAAIIDDEYRKAQERSERTN